MWDAGLVQLIKTKQHTKLFPLHPPGENSRRGDFLHYIKDTLMHFLLVPSKYVAPEAARVANIFSFRFFFYNIGMTQGHLTHTRPFLFVALALYCSINYFLRKTCLLIFQYQRVRVLITLIKDYQTPIKSGSKYY